MKLIKPSVEIIPQESGLNGIFKSIELAGRTCYSEDTEILTNSGWKKFSDLKDSDIVLSYNPDNNSLIWDTPNVVKKDINDEIIEITHANIKLSMTKDHRVYQSIPCKRDYSFLAAEQLAGLKKINHSKQTRFRLPKYFINSKRDPLYIMAENKVLFYSKYIKCGSRKDEEFKIEVPINKDFMVILGAYISEGHTNHRNKFGSGNNCQITQDENSELYSNVLLALDNLNWKYNIRKDPRKPNIKWIIFGTNSCWTEFFDNLVGKGSKNKHLPLWFRELSDEYLNILVHNLYLGDGSHSITRKERYLSISKTLLDELQQVFILLGKNATYTYDSNISQRCTLEESTRDSWIIDRKKHIKILPKEKRTVYCTSTKSGIICVRYKNKTSWCGNCYKSEDKITDKSCVEFVSRMISSGHNAMLEFGTVYLKYTVAKGSDIDPFYKYRINSHSKVCTHGDSDPYYTVYVTTNYRVIIENGWVDDLEYLCEPTKYHEKRVCAKFITDRGVSHELVRHRVFSFAQESTRYCNYSKDKFDNQLTFIVPSYMDLNFCGRDSIDNPDFGNNNIYNMEGKEEHLYKEDDELFYRDFFHTCEYTEEAYLMSLDKGLTPQQARQVLPNALKTEINMCGFVSDWKHFFALRDNPKAHPDMQVLAKSLHQQFIDNGLL